MPEWPDVELYLQALRPRVQGAVLWGVRLASPFLLRTVEPGLDEFRGKRVQGLFRLGKRLVFGFEPDYFLVLHLMIAGRLHWKGPEARIPAKHGLAAFDFESGTLLLTEAGSKKRAALHAVQGPEALRAHDPGGVDPIEAGAAEFRSALRRENHTLKRALTDPRLFAGIGNAYSDEILHRARLSPLKLTADLSAEEVDRLRRACRETLTEAFERLKAEAGEGFPEGVTAFRPWMAVHGRYKEPCPACRAPVQRIRYAENETNYCPRCQTGGRVLADRSLSRLLKGDWPRTVEELEGPRR